MPSSIKKAFILLTSLPDTGSSIVSCALVDAGPYTIVSVVPPPCSEPCNTGTLLDNAGNLPTPNGVVPDTLPIPTIVSLWFDNDVTLISPLFSAILTCLLCNPLDES